MNHFVKSQIGHLEILAYLCYADLLHVDTFPYSITKITFVNITTNLIRKSLVFIEKLLSSQWQIQSSRIPYFAVKIEFYQFFSLKEQAKSEYL